MFFKQIIYEMQCSKKYIMLWICNEVKYLYVFRKCNI